MGQVTTAAAALGRCGFPLDGLVSTVFGSRKEDIDQMALVAELDSQAPRARELSRPPTDMVL